MSWITIAAALGLLVLLVLAQRAAYHNGFRDGALWAWEGEHYPSKPAAGWWGWAPMRQRMGRRSTRTERPDGEGPLGAEEEVERLRQALDYWHGQADREQERGRQRAEQLARERDGRQLQVERLMDPIVRAKLLEVNPQLWILCGAGPVRKLRATTHALRTQLQIFRHAQKRPPDRDTDALILEAREALDATAAWRDREAEDGEDAP